MPGLGKLLPCTVPICLQKFNLVFVIGDAFLQILGIQHMAEAYPVMGIEKFPPRCRPDPFRNHPRVIPLVFFDFPVTQHIFDHQMLFTDLNLGIHPRVALEQFDLLIHLIIKLREERLAGRGKNFHQAGFILCPCNAFSQSFIQSQLVGNFNPRGAVQFLANLALLPHLFHHPF